MLQGVRYRLRSLSREPISTLTSVTALGLGIGSATLVFCVVNSVLIRDFPYKEPDRLVFASGIDTQTGETAKLISYPNFADIRDQVSTLEDAAAFASRMVTIEGRDGPEAVPALRVSGQFFQTLGVAAHLGQVRTTANDSSTEERFVVLSHGFWQRRFGSDQNVIGQVLRVGDHPYTITAVLPREFRFRPAATTNPELWLSLAPSELEMTHRESSWLYVIARLKASATISELRSELAAFSARLAQGHPQTNARTAFNATALRDYFVSEVEGILIALLCAVGFVVLIACANVSSLLLARSLARQREIGICSALGAGRMRLIADSLTDSVLLSFGGGAVGLILAAGVLGVVSRMTPKGVPRVDEISLDWTAFAFTLVATVLASAVSGLLPASKVSRLDPMATLRGLALSGEHPNRVQRLLVAFEVALAMILTTGCGLTLNSFLRLVNVDAGFRYENILTMQLSLLSRQKPAELVSFTEEALAAVRQTGAVEEVAVVDFLPLAFGGATSTSRRSSLTANPAGGNPEDEITYESRSASSAYFRALKIPIKSGGGFDEPPLGSRVVVVSERLAELLWPGEDPVGKRWLAPVLKDRAPVIVGVVGDVRHHALGQEPRPTLYALNSQAPRQQMMLIAHTSQDPGRVVPIIRGRILSVDPNVLITDIRTMEERVSESVALPRFYASLFGWFALLAATISAVGVYGLVAYSVSRRTREIGIRMSLGARPFDIMRLIVWEGTMPVIGGIAVGLACSAALGASVERFLWGVSPTDPATLLGAVLMMGGFGVLACYLPARRGGRLDPVVTLRNE